MRIRIIFAKTEAMRFTSHLDLQRTWERTFRRAELPISYSLGYNPRPKINLASALPLGFTGEKELLDARLKQQLSITDIETRLQKSLPPGIQLREIKEIDLSSPSLQSRVIAAEYLITFLDPFPTLSDQLNKILTKSEILRERRGKTYDLRPLIETLTIIDEDDQGLQQVFTTLTAKEGATGRPEEVIDALGYDPLAARVHRTNIFFTDT